MRIPFNKPSIVGNELEYIRDAVQTGKISGDGKYTRKCHNRLKKMLSVRKALLTTSGTGALEMTALLLDIQPGDEVIMPSYTFVSTANAFLLRGAKPIFVDIRKDTLNIDEALIEDRISDNTRAIVPVHYAGVACEMDRIIEIGRGKNLVVVEDAAQGINSTYRNKYLGSIGDLGVLSFHETKNLICGEGGALLINNEKFIERAEIIWEKGTNRRKFFRGELDKYTWVDIGSSYLMSDILAAYLYAQLEKAHKIQQARRRIFSYYYNQLKPMEAKGKLRLPEIPAECLPNYHLFYILLNNPQERDTILRKLKAAGILAVFHYVPLHLSPMGRKLGYRKGDFPVTEDLSRRLIRLPLYHSLSPRETRFIISELLKLL